MITVYQDKFEMQDSKYQKVRGELDRLKFLEHLGVDSVDLVDRLVKEYTKLFDTFMKLKKKSDNKSDPGLANLQHQLDLLNDNYASCKEENQRLKKQLEQGGISEKIRALQTSLNSCRVKYEKQLDEMRDKLSSNEIKIEELSYSKSSLTEENQRIRGMLERSKNEGDHSNQQLTNLLEKKKKQIVRLEEQNSKCRIQISSIERLYQQQKQKWANSQNQTSKQSTGVLQVLREELAETEGKLEACKSQLANQHDKNRELSQKIRALTEQLASVRHNQDHAKNSYSIETNAKSKLESLLKQSMQKCSDLKDKIILMERSKESDDEEIAKLTAKVKDLANKNTNLMNNMNRLQEELGVLNSSFTQKVRELRQAENKKVTFEKRIKDLESELEEKENSHSQSYDNSGDLGREEFEKKQAVYEKQLQIAQTELKLMQQNQHKILSEKNAVQIQVKKLHMIISESNKQIEIARDQKQSLIKENKELKSHLNNTQSEGYSTKTEAMRLKQTSEEYEIMMQDLKVAIRNEQNINKVHALKVAELEKEIQHKNIANKKMFEDNKQLQMLVQSLEKTKGELFEKYRMSTEEKSATDNMSLEHRKEYNLLLDERKELMERLRGKQMAVSTLSAEYDQLQNQLDSITQENYYLKSEIAKLNKESESFNKGLGEREMSIQGLSIKVKNLQDALEKYERSYHSKCDQLNQAFVQLQKRKLDAQQCRNQISLLVMHNKEIEKNNERMKLGYSDLQRKLRDRIAQIDEYRETAGAFKIENQNLREELRLDRENLYQQNNYNHEITDEYNHVLDTLNQRDVQLKEYSEACRQLQFKEQQYVTQITHLERQIRSLGDEMIKKEEQIHQLKQDRDAYRAQVSTSRRSYSDTTDWRAIYQEKVRYLETENLNKRRECDLFKAEIRKLEKIIQQEREKNFYLEQEVRKSKVGEDGHQTPIKMFYKSQVESENWDGYNRELSQIEHSLQDPEKKVFTNSGVRVGESFESESSISSRQRHERLQELQKQYAATMLRKK